MAEYIKKENIVNGAVLGGLAGAAIYWGDKIRDPLTNFISKIIPENAMIFGDFTIPLIVIIGGSIIGVIVDRL